ncbi:MAG TPA: sulfite exporter TauE/SafE family protein [Bacteroidia bacterium]|nr:MAG: integral membrane protein [Bacteroidetes bacterium OLB10]MBV6454085.1 hypothetical protein [Bacteroidia bacterium]MBX3105574.1 sulfite exporter TauE/SafE family protein [Bacteroidota bacterium]OQB60972.1 MAG: hypothetical protein BWX95_02022 [Bacteroidetes bacterium ADurb.Bin141]MCB0848910.1 sulfite exporter TauE/SafE family protein [Bacteroidota bacterium]
MAFYLSAFILGLFGSLHCAGMCGPIAMMLPANKNFLRKANISRLLYNSGRAVAYMLIGLVFGILGSAISISGYQKQLSIFSGIVILLIIFFTAAQKFQNRFSAFIARITMPVRILMKKLFAQQSPAAHFGIGLTNGFLPCGLVYLAAAGSVSAGSTSGSVLYMALFALGTFPVMLAISFSASLLKGSWRNLYSKATPVVSIALALFLIYRGTQMKTDCHVTKSPPAMISCEKPGQPTI